MRRMPISISTKTMDGQNFDIPRSKPSDGVLLVSRIDLEGKVLTLSLSLCNPCSLRGPDGSNKACVHDCHAADL